MWKCSVICLLLVTMIYGKPQNDQGIEDIVNSVFTSTTTRTPPSRRGGFGTIVTPEPIVGPTSEPTILQGNDGNRCICVPYYLCDPTNNTIRTDGEIDGFGAIDIRFNPMTCQDVLDVCCRESNTQTEPINPTPINERPNRPTGCGIRNVGGIDFTLEGNLNNEAGFGEFPWTVALIRIPENENICGGSLIHPRVVITGNHCVRKLQPSQLKVRAGEWDTQTLKERLPYQERVASQIISHPSYVIKTLANDIALVVLEQPFDLADHINVVCLPQQNAVSQSRDCFASGWGKDVFGKVGKYSVIMKRIPLPLVPNDQCQTSLRQTRLGPNFNLDQTFLCAGGQQGVDTCEGDGGAPLVCPTGTPSENRYAQNGIVAWGIGCNEARPAVYANVALAREWIDSQITNLGLDPKVYTA